MGSQVHNSPMKRCGKARAIRPNHAHRCDRREGHTLGCHFSLRCCKPHSLGPCILACGHAGDCQLGLGSLTAAVASDDFVEVCHYIGAPHSPWPGEPCIKPAGHEGMHELTPTIMAGAGAGYVGRREVHDVLVQVTNDDHLGFGVDAAAHAEEDSAQGLVWDRVERRFRCTALGCGRVLPEGEPACHPATANLGAPAKRTMAERTQAEDLVRTMIDDRPEEILALLFDQMRKRGWSDTRAKDALHKVGWLI